MGATGSSCSSCFDRWVTLSDNAIQEKCNTLERKITSIETNNLQTSIHNISQANYNTAIIKLWRGR